MRSRGLAVELSAARSTAYGEASVLMLLFRVTDSRRTQLLEITSIDGLGACLWLTLTAL